MHLFGVLLLSDFLVLVYPIMSTTLCSCLISSNTLPKLRVMICFRMIEIVMVKISNITHGVPNFM